MAEIIKQHISQLCLLFSVLNCLGFPYSECINENPLLHNCELVLFSVSLFSVFFPFLGVGEGIAFNFNTTFCDLCFL